MMIDLIKENLNQIIICVFMFLVGVGIGAAITDAINNWKEK